LLQAAAASQTLPSGKADPGVLLAPAGAADADMKRFIEALARHRHFERETDPPRP
jgi:catalase